MPHITPPFEPPNTIFWDIALLFWRMYIRWDMLATEVKDVWLLGTHLYTGFTYLRDYAGEGFQFFDSANTTVQNIIMWLDGITDGDVLYRLIDALFPNLVAIINDALTWFGDILSYYSDDLYQLAASSWMWVRNQLYDQTEWFWQFINNPGDFILERLNLWYSWFRGFLDNPMDFIPDWVRGSFWFVSALENNPTNTVITWIRMWFPWFGDFLTRPEDYIKWWLSLINVDLTPFVNNPTLWFQTWLGNWLLIRPEDWSDIYRRIITVCVIKMRASKQIYVDMLKDLLIDILLWFM